jgi:hypothetical protein
VKIDRVVSDGARGLKKGIEEADIGIEHQLDLFHTLQAVLRVENCLEREAYQAIKKEAERSLVVDSAKSERVFEKRYEQWLQAASAMEVRIDMYEAYSWLVSELREGFFFVDAESGLLRSEKEMEARIGVVALLMRELHHLSVQAVAERLERQKGELVKYLTPLQEKLAELEAEVGDKELVRLCLKEWQLEKETAQGKKAESLETCRKRFRGWKEEVVEQVRKTIRWLPDLSGWCEHQVWWRLSTVGCDPFYGGARGMDKESITC